MYLGQYISSVASHCADLNCLTQLIPGVPAAVASTLQVTTTTTVQGTTPNLYPTSTTTTGYASAPSSTTQSFTSAHNGSPAPVTSNSTDSNGNSNKTTATLYSITASSPTLSPTSPTLSPTSPTPYSTLHGPHHAPAGAIVGGVIAGLILIAGCVFLVWALRRRRRKQLEVEPVARDNSESMDFTTNSIYATRSLPEPADIGTDWQPLSHSLAAADFDHPSVSQSDKLAPNRFQPGNILSWAAAQMPRQNQILLRENGEFWDEIEDLHRENEKLRLSDGHEAYTTGNLPELHY